MSLADIYFTDPKNFALAPELSTFQGGGLNW